MKTDSDHTYASDKCWADLQQTLPGVNVRAGLKRALGQYGVYMALLNKFRKRFRLFGKNVRDMLERSDTAAALMEVHSLKGVAAGIGAEELEYKARELEMQLRRGQLPTAFMQTEAMVDTLLGCLDTLDYAPPDSRIVPDSSAAAIDTGTDRWRQWSVCLGQMQEALRKLQVNEVKRLFEKLQGRSWPEKQTLQLKKLEQMLSAYQYKDAAEYVADMARNDEPAE